MNLSKLLKITAVGLLIYGLLPSNAMATSSTGQANALVITPLTIAPTQPLNFGGFVGGTAGTITINFSLSPLSTTGGIQTLAPSSASGGVFSVTGEPNSIYFVSLDPSVTLSNSIDTMTATLDSDLPDIGGQLIKPHSFSHTHLG
jgi:hypothetical protein